VADGGADDHDCAIVALFHENRPESTGSCHKSETSVNMRDVTPLALQKID
jgi:hypothetical protein